ncbi:MAG: putative amidohydrolase YtcJ [Acidimicrobiales bacterium]
MHELGEKYWAQSISYERVFVLGIEDEIGSIRAGMEADFAVLESDPHEIPQRDIKDIAIWGTVFGGQPCPLDEQPRVVHAEPSGYTSALKDISVLGLSSKAGGSR